MMYSLWMRLCAAWCWFVGHRLTYTVKNWNMSRRFSCCDRCHRAIDLGPRP